MNHIAFCLRDCASFPCEHFSSGPYPFSKAFLEMQQRRRRQPPPVYTPDGSHVTVAAEYWDRLQKSDLISLSARTQFTPSDEGRLLFRFLNEDVVVDVPQRCLKRLDGSNWKKTDDTLLELATVLYLINVRDVYPLGRDLVGPRDLKEGHFFQGPHELKIAPLVERYGKDIRSFRLAAEHFEGEPIKMADAGYRLKPFPRIHLYYLLWKEDDEFPPRMSVLFDRSIEEVLAADAIWGLVNRVSTELLKPGV
jgi:hypothetical protein